MGKQNYLPTPPTTFLPLTRLHPGVIKFLARFVLPLPPLPCDGANEGWSVLRCVSGTASTRRRQSRGFSSSFTVTGLNDASCPPGLGEGSSPNLQRPLDVFRPFVHPFASIGYLPVFVSCSSSLCVHLWSCLSRDLVLFIFRSGH